MILLDSDVLIDLLRKYPPAEERLEHVQIGATLDGVLAAYPSVVANDVL